MAVIGGPEHGLLRDSKPNRLTVRRPPLVGRERELELYQRTIDSVQPPLLCFYGPTKIGKSYLLETIHRASEYRPERTVLVDLANCRTPAEAGEVVRRSLTRRRAWVLMTRFAMVQEALTELLPSAGREPVGPPAALAIRPADPSGGVRGLPGGMLHTLWRWVGRRILRPRKVRWVKAQLASMPPKGSALSSEQVGRTAALEALVPVALAHDLADLAKRKSFRPLALLFDHHERHGAPLSATPSESFILVLARELNRLGAPVAVVVTRDSPLATHEAWIGNTWVDDQGALRSDRLKQQRLEPLDDRAAAALLAAMRVSEPLAGELVSRCFGHPAVLVGCAWYGIAPPTAVAPDGGANVPPMLADVLAKLLVQRTDEERQLLRLAATVRVFDRALLDRLVGASVPIERIEAECRRGMIEEVGDPNRSDRTWRVEPVWRGLLYTDLATGANRNVFVDGHERALAHLEHLRENAYPDDDEDRFALELERLYHRAALFPAEGLDELLGLVDEALRGYRVDRCRQILMAVEELHSLDDGYDVQALLLKVKLYGDLHDYDTALAMLAEAAKRHPLVRGFAPPAVSIQLEIAKLDRLRGAYQPALDRYWEIEMAARMARDPAVVAHCEWQETLIHKQLHDVPSATEALTSARRELRTALDAGDREHVDARARRFGIRRLSAKPAHMLRHEAELLRLQGDYRAAHARLDEAVEAYDRTDDVRPRAYADVVRAHVARMEGRPSQAHELAAKVRRMCEDGTHPGERLRRFALRAEVLAGVALGVCPEEAAEALAKTPHALYPAGRPSGLLALAELHRREKRWPEALAAYEEVVGAVERSQGRVEECGALLGMLECHRATTRVGARATAPLALLDELLAEPCVDHVPWLGLRVQLQRAYWRQRERVDALGQAAAIAQHRFAHPSVDGLGPDAPNPELALVESFRHGLADPRFEIPPMPLEHL